jgi:hypothetical protein
LLNLQTHKLRHARGQLCTKYQRCSTRAWTKTHCRSWCSCARWASTPAR